MRASASFLALSSRRLASSLACCSSFFPQPVELVQIRFDPDFRLLGGPGRFSGGFQLVLQRPAAVFQLGNDVLQTAIVSRQAVPGVLHHRWVHPQPFRYGKGVRAPRNAHEQAVGGAQGRHVELTAPVFHPLGLDGVGLQLRVMGGRSDPRALFPQPFENSDGQGRPSTGSVPAPSSSSRTRLPPSASSRIRMMLVMWAEKVERDCSMDCSSPISANTAENTDRGAAVVRRRHQPAHRHQSEQADGFQGDGFAAGVGPGDDQGVEGGAELHVDGDHLLRIDQRMAGVAEPDPPSSVRRGQTAFIL